MPRRLIVKITMLSTVLLMGVGLVGCEGQGEATSVDENSIPTISAESGLPWVDEIQSTDPDHITLALKYVSYVDNENQAVLSEQEAKAVVRQINSLYKQCNMHFRTEEFLAVNPKDYGLDFNPSRMTDLQSIRIAFDDPGELVVINTGKWNESGGLGADGANAWTVMPGNSPSGAVIESVVTDDAPLVAHELGHYLSLDHVSDQNNMMSPIIYPSSTQLSSGQCQAMRDAAKTVRIAAIR